MTKKDYIAIGAALKMLREATDNNTNEASNQVRVAMWTECVLAIARACEKDNPTFNYGKFIAACGIPNALGKERTLESEGR